MRMADGTSPAATELLVCVTCRKQGADPADPRRPGRVLHDALVAGEAPAGVTITPVECLQNCSGACTVALRGGAGKWTYVFGNLDEADQAPMLLEAAARYRDAPDGIIPWRERPQHFKRNCVARIPPLTPIAEAAE